MRSNNSNGSRALWARGLIVLGAVLGLGLSARPAATAPFAYVVINSSLFADEQLIFSSVVSVIDTATNVAVGELSVGCDGFTSSGCETSSIAVTPDGKHVYVAKIDFPFTGVLVFDTATNNLVAGVPVNEPGAIAITPDGKHVYVSNFNNPGTVSVIATATNTVVATVPTVPVGGGIFRAIAITPDGKHVYVSNDNNPGTVSVIAAASNTVVATVAVGFNPEGVAITPDGKHAYVTNDLSNTVSVIDTATNTVVTTVPVAGGTFGVAVTQDGKHVYVTGSSISVIDTATNEVVATVPVASGAIAISPDGKHAYVAGINDTALVIATATNTVVATIALPGENSGPSSSSVSAVGIIPPPLGVPFLAFNAKLAIQFGSIPTKDAFGFGSNFILSSIAPAIDPLTDPVTLQIGAFATTIPAGSFIKQADGSFTFQGVIDGVGLGALIKPTGTMRYLFEAKGRGANLTGTENTVYATLIIG
ncbi:MAG: YncE family protein, partial [Methylocella sp.]